MAEKPTLLMILDGFGLRDDNEYNAVNLALTPNIKRFTEKFPHCKLQASGYDVGLPDGQMGNSEVGHLNIGAGRIVYQDLTRIFKAIEDKSFFQNPVLVQAMQKVKEKNASLHLMGLVSDGGVHSHIEHLFALVKMAKEQGLDKVYIHAFLDGRDTPPQSGLDFIQQLEKELYRVGIGQIATLCGRYYAMDRDNRWERVQKAYQMIALGEAPCKKSAVQGIKESYDAGTTDEFVQPFCVGDFYNIGLKDEDGVIFFNFRSDRAREITRALTLKDFSSFDRGSYKPIKNFVCLTEYDATFTLPIAFSTENLDNTLGEVLSRQGLKQLRIAETEKYAHVTFFFNGGVEVPNPNEDRILIPSPKVATYDLQPHMSAYDVTTKLLTELDKEVYDVVIMNYANADMVGHTGILAAAIKAVEAVDECLGKIVDKVLEKQGTVCILADHGNAERMVEKDGKTPHTAHTNNKVPFILIGKDYEKSLLRDDGILADVAPTMLDILKIQKPKEMTGKSLILK